jgi:hypothetical protein
MPISLSGSLNLSGSLTTTGTITATTLVVQTITSSISSITGSTNFGSLAANTHSFTGSLSVTGSGYFGSDMFTYNNGGIFFSGGGSYETGIFKQSGGTLALQTGTTPRLQITSGGNVGIGTSTPTDIAGFTSLTINNSASGPLIDLNNSGVNNMRFLCLSAADQRIYGAGALSFYTSGSNRMSIVSNGKVSISAPTTADAFTVQGANNYWTSILTSGTTTSQAYGLYIKAGTNGSDVPFLIQNTSGTDLLRMLGTGVVTIPSQPSFYATSTAGDTAYTAGQVIVFNTTRHNTGSHYNTSTGRFTSPVAGKYLFTLNVYCYGGYTSAILLYINGAQYAVSDVTPYISASASSFATTLGFTLVWELSAGDYIEVRARSASQIYRAHSHFSGQLLS